MQIPYKAKQRAYMAARRQWRELNSIPRAGWRSSMNVDEATAPKVEAVIVKPLSELIGEAKP